MYWEHCGKDNTKATIEQALARAGDLDIKYIVVASNTGWTVEEVLDRAAVMEGNEIQLICVSHHVGFAGPGVDEMSTESRQRLQAQGIPVLTTTHLFAGVDRAVRNKFGGVYPAEIMAQTLRMLGQGVKVAVEVTGMALDAGHIPFGEDILAIAGSGRGADTAIVLRPAHSNNFFDTKIKEIICKPREF